MVSGMQSRRHVKRVQDGFTLVELMVVLVVFGIVVFVGVPQFNSFIANQQAKTAAQQLYSSLTYARSEAIRSNGVAAVEPSEDGWEQGWVVVNGDGDVLRQFDNAVGGWSLALEPNNVTRVEFQRNGRASPRVRFQICGRPGDTAVTERVVRLDLTGRPNLTLGNLCDDGED